MVYYPRVCQGSENLGSEERFPMVALMYAFPAMMDCVVSQILFVNMVRAAQMGFSDVAISGMLGACSLSYLVSCWVVGLRLRARNAAAMLISACILLLILCGLFPIAGNIVVVYVLTGGVGMTVGLFFPAFQVFMKEVDRGRAKPLTYSTGLYTFSWSTGCAVGPLFSGFLMETGDNGWIHCYVVSGVVCLITAAGIWLLRHHVEAGGSLGLEGTQSGTIPECDRCHMPDLAWLGWIGIGVGMTVMCGVRGLFPALAEKKLGLTESTQGTVFFLLSFVQGITGLALSRGRLWMYRSLPILFLGTLGATGVLCLAIGKVWFVFYVGAICFGVYSGFFCFYAVFHSLAHPSKGPRYVSINEMVVAGAGIIGTIGAGMLSETFRSYTIPYGLGAVLVVAVVSFQAAMCRKYSVSPPAVPGEA